MGAPTLVVLRAFALARSWFEPTTLRRAPAKDVLAFVRARQRVPARSRSHFARGTLENYWRGTSGATTDLLDAPGATTTRDRTMTRHRAQVRHS
jgi:hypothetical protein